MDNQATCLSLGAEGLTFIQIIPTNIMQSVICTTMMNIEGLGFCPLWAEPPRTPHMYNQTYFC